MATRYYSYGENEFYHVYNRGNSKQVIFKGESDYEQFKKILYIANSTKPFKLRELNDSFSFDLDRENTLVHIGAYCIMPNHFHILVAPAQKNGIPQFMLKLGTSYASYFNKKYTRTGSLFEGSYKSKWVDSDRYLKYLFAYIHLNPFRDKDGAIKNRYNETRLVEFKHSSLLDYFGLQRSIKSILAPEKFPQYFKNSIDHRRELYDWLDFYQI